MNVRAIDLAIISFLMGIMYYVSGEDKMYLILMAFAIGAFLVIAMLETIGEKKNEKEKRT